MPGTSEGARKAAATRKKEDPRAFSKMGEKGGRSEKKKQKR